MNIFLHRVSNPPQTLDELGDSLNLWDTLNADKPNIEAKFQPLYDQFTIMEKYEVPIPEEVQTTLNQLSNDWITFQETLMEAETMLKKNKVSEA
jgi:dynein heavy chain